jgi:hypothetical protein
MGRPGDVGRRPGVAPPEDPAGHRGAQQRGGLRHQADHVEERGVDLLVACRGRDHPVEVAPHQAVGQRGLPAGRSGIAQVLAGSDHPRSRVGPRHRLLDAGRGCGQVASGAAAVILERATERLGRQGGRSHPLPVDRVDCAGRVADGHEPLGRPAQLLVVAPLVGGAPVADDGRQRLQLLDHVGQDRRPHLPDERCEAALVGGGQVAVRTGDRQDPAVALQREQHAHAGGVRRPGLQEDGPVAPHGLVAGAAVGAGGVAELGVDHGLGRPLVAGGLQPGGGVRPPTAGVDHQVREHPLGGLVRRRAPGAQVDADDPAGIHGQARDLDAGADFDAARRQHPAAGSPLDQVAAGRHHGPATGAEGPHPAGGRQPQHVAGRP